MAENPSFYATFEKNLKKFERTVESTSIVLCLDFALKTVEEVNRNIFVHNEPKYSDKLVREYLQKYRASFQRRES
jgi:hypothetical protein